MMMKKLWETSAATVITLFAVSMLIQLIKPYVPYMLIAGGVYVVGIGIYKHARNW